MKRGTIAKILVLLMVIQTWFLWDLSQSFKPNPEKFFENLCHIMSWLSPKEALAGIVTVFGPKQYIRTTGKPDVYQDAFSATAGPAQIIILNGEENGQNRVSSTIISLNGGQIFGTSDFNQNVYRLEKSIELSQMNTLMVELRSQPESYLRIEIIPTTSADVLPVGPEGGTLHFPNGVILKIPAGAVTEETELEVTNVQCEQIDEILSAYVVTSHNIRCLGGFTGKPDGQVFLLPVKATVPVLPLETGEVPIQIKVNLNNQGFLLSPTNLTYLGQEGVVEMEIRGFSANAAGALSTDEAAEYTVPPPPCCFWVYQPEWCCCVEKVEVVSEASELSSSRIGPSGQVECTMSAMKVTTTYPTCDGKPQQTSWSQAKSGDCPEMICQINVNPSVIDLFVCKDVQPNVTVNCENKDGTPVPFTNSKFMPFWNNDNSYAAQVDPRTGKIKGLKEGSAHLEATWPIPDQGFIPGQAVVNVRSNIRSFSVSPSQKTIKVGKGIPLQAEVIGADGIPFDASDVGWSSTNRDIADVTQEKGSVTTVYGADCGTAIITAEYQYGCEKVLTTATITVEDRVSYCQVNPPAITLSVGEAMLVDAIPYDAQGNEATDIENFINWSPSDDITASVSPSVGLLTFVGANNIGQSWITATYNYPSTTRCGQKSCQAPVTVNCDLCTFNVRPATQTLTIGESTTLTAELRDVKGSPVNILPPSTVTWTSNSGIVSFNPATGLQTSVRTNNAGTATITATYTDMFGQKTATATIRVIVPPKTWHRWSQVGNFNNMKLGADGHGNTFVAWQERSLPEVYIETSNSPQTVYTGICLGHVGSGEITPLTCENTFGAVLRDFFVDKTGNIIVTYYTRDVIPPNIEYKTWVKRYNVDSGWDETPGLIGKTILSPQIAADSNGNAIVVWIEDPDSYTISAMRYDAGQGWQSQPQVVQQPYIGGNFRKLMDIAMDSQGNAIMVWSKYLPAEGSYGIFTKRYRVDSGWDPDFIRIALPTDIFSLDIVMDSNGNAIVLWDNPDFGIRARRYDAKTDDWWPPLPNVINIANKTETYSFYYPPAISMDESGNALVTYWQFVQTGTSYMGSLMSRGYSIEHGWGDAVALMVNHPNNSWSTASMYGGGNATAVNVFDIVTRHMSENYMQIIGHTLDTHLSTREFRTGEGWGETISDTVSLEFPVCYTISYRNEQNILVIEPVCYDYKTWENPAAPPIIDSHGNATAVMLIERGHWEGHWGTNGVGDIVWRLDFIVYEDSEVIVMRFQ